MKEKNVPLSSVEATEKEKQEHERIMLLLDTVEAYSYMAEDAEGTFMAHGSRRLQDGEVLYIMKRGNHDEIQKMIERYVKLCWGMSSSSYRPELFSDEVQKMIAERNNKDEMNAYFDYAGFGEAGQDVVLERRNILELATYISRHGFAAKQQLLLKEIDYKLFLFHIEKHGLHDEVIFDMLERMRQSGNTEEFYAYIERREFTVSQQRKMLETVASQEFRSYIYRYGLWEDAHASLVQYRSDDDIEEYIKRHRYLSYSGEKELAQKANFYLNRAYVSNKCYTNRGRHLEHFLSCLVQQGEVDYESLKAGYAMYSPWREGDSPGYLVMKFGTTADVIDFINSRDGMYYEDIAAVFARNVSDEMKAYIAKVKR